MINIADMTDAEREAAAVQAAALIEYYAAQGLAGERAPYPLPLYTALSGATVQVADEVFIVDDEGYWLQRRSPREKYFGANKLHLNGGYGRPGSSSDPIENARVMGRTEMGFDDLEYIAGPVATYQWTRGVDHPFGWPRSEVRIYRAIGKPSDRPDVVKYRRGDLPNIADMLDGRAGEIHLRFVQECLAWLWSPNHSCVDLNVNW